MSWHLLDILQNVQELLLGNGESPGILTSHGLPEEKQRAGRYFGEDRNGTNPKSGNVYGSTLKYVIGDWCCRSLWIELRLRDDLPIRKTPLHPFLSISKPQGMGDRVGVQCR